MDGLQKIPTAGGAYISIRIDSIDAYNLGLIELNCNAPNKRSLRRSFLLPKT
jgi:hypothetical protein